MKILYLSRSLLPSKTANSIHVMKMCQALSKNGHDVTLVGSLLGRYPISSIYEYYGVKQSFEISVLKGRSDKLSGLLHFLVNFYFYIKEMDAPDIIYGRDLFTLSMTAAIYNAPFIFEAHKPPTTFFHLFLTRFLINHKNLIKLVVITSSLKEEYIKTFPSLKSDEILIAPDGADIPEKNTGQNKSGTQRDTLIIGYVGHLYPGRGMEIIHELAKELPHHEFHIVGGSEKDIRDWQKICRPLGNIHFKGFVPNKELGSYYKHMDIVLAPYQNKVSIYGGGGDTSKWMSPLKIFEYMAFSKPIIASDLPVLKEILIDGFNAILCRADSVDQWLNAIKRLNFDQNFRDSIAQAAFNCLQEKYTWEKRAAAIIHDIEALLPGECSC